MYPFEDPGGSSLSRTIQNVLRGARRPLPPTVSPECAARIDGLLLRDPARRTGLQVGCSTVPAAGGVEDECGPAPLYV